MVNTQHTILTPEETERSASVMRCLCLSGLRGSEMTSAEAEVGHVLGLCTAIGLALRAPSARCS